jgi:hypothetical protein
MSDPASTRRDGSLMIRWWHEFTGFLERRHNDHVVARRLRTYVGTVAGR